MIKEFLQEINKTIPVEWDRYTKDGGYYYIYGWIKRSDGQRDFILIDVYIEGGELKGGFVTSSAKYSLAIYKLFYKKESGHTKCEKIETLNT